MESSNSESLSPFSIQLSAQAIKDIRSKLVLIWVKDIETNDDPQSYKKNGVYLRQKDDAKTGPNYYFEISRKNDASVEGILVGEISNVVGQEYLDDPEVKELTVLGAQSEITHFVLVSLGLVSAYYFVWAFSDMFVMGSGVPPHGSIQELKGK